ncbi:MAG: hypothetical protein ACR2LA_08880 [Acidimicrobiales bacterium]
MAPPRGPALSRHRGRLAAVRARTSAGLLTAWDQLAGYDEADINAYTTRVAPLLTGAKVATVAEATAFYALLLDMAPPPVVATSVPTAPDLRAPFAATWHALAQGRDYVEAVQVGRSTADAVGSTFIQSTARQTGDAVVEASGRPVRWVRVAEPGACEWCQERDGSTYGSAADGDYGHERCFCSVTPAD